MMVSQVLLVVGIVGLVTSAGFLLMVVIATFRFSRSKPAPVAMSALPPVTVLKPVCGLEPRLLENLASFFEQEYPDYEIVFGARSPEDPAVEVVRSVQRRYPHVPSRMVFSGDPKWPNAKIWSLKKMLAEGSHRHIVLSDSDVHVDRDYLRKVVAPLLDSDVGLVTCVYRGVPAAGIWSRLDALGMSVEMTSGVLVADMLEGMKFALGPSMATRRDVLDSIGGLDALADYYADDYVLGNEVHKSGRKVVLAPHVIEQCSGATFSSSMRHQARWMRSTRFSRPAGHFGTALTFAMPFGVIAFIAGLCCNHALMGGALLAGAFLNRVLMSIVAGWFAVHDDRALTNAWLYPVRDLMGFYFWCTSYMGREIVWRNGERYRFHPGGKMSPVLTREAKPVSQPVAVDHLS